MLLKSSRIVQCCSNCATATTCPASWQTSALQVGTPAASPASSPLFAPLLQLQVVEQRLAKGRRQQRGQAGAGRQHAQHGRVEKLLQGGWAARQRGREAHQWCQRQGGTLLGAIEVHRALEASAAANASSSGGSPPPRSPAKSRRLVAGAAEAAPACAAAPPAARRPWPAPAGPAPLHARNKGAGEQVGVTQAVPLCCTARTSMKGCANAACSEAAVLQSAWPRRRVPRLTLKLDATRQHNLRLLCPGQRVLKAPALGLLLCLIQRQIGPAEGSGTKCNIGARRACAPARPTLPVIWHRGQVQHAQGLPVCGDAHAHEQPPRLLARAQLGYGWHGRLPGRLGPCLRPFLQRGSLAVAAASSVLIIGCSVVAGAATLRLLFLLWLRRRRWRVGRLLPLPLAPAAPAGGARGACRCFCRRGSSFATAGAPLRLL